jgi:hypothetical protein
MIARPAVRRQRFETKKEPPVDTPVGGYVFSILGRLAVGQHGLVVIVEGGITLVASNDVVEVGAIGSHGVGGNFDTCLALETKNVEHGKLLDEWTC